MPKFKRKLQKASDDILKMLDISQKSYVALSWGKQSVVLMHLVFEVNPNIPGVFWAGPDIDIIADFDVVKSKFMEKYPIKYIEQYCEHNFKKTASDWQQENNYDGVFMGLVKDESKARMITLKKGNYNNIFTYKNKNKRCCPLSDWSDMDIAAYVAKYNLYMLSTYRRFGFNVRTSARIKKDCGSYTERGYDLLSSTCQKEFDRRKHCTLK